MKKKSVKIYRADKRNMKYGRKGFEKQYFSHAKVARKIGVYLQYLNPFLK